MVKVYAIQIHKGGAIKIGASKDVARRLVSMQVGCPDKIKLIAEFDGGFDLEKTLHALLKPHRVKGEWFEQCPFVMQTLSRAEDGTLFDGTPEERVAFGKLLRKRGLTFQRIATVFGESLDWARALRERRTYVRKRPVKTTEEMLQMAGIDRAIQLAGGQTALSRMFDPPVTQQAVSKMKAQGYCSLDVAHQISEMFPQIDRYELLNPIYRRPLAQAHRPGAGVISYKD